MPKKNIAAGGGLRTLQQRKNAENNSSMNENKKVLLPLNDQHVTKAKACQEMIMYERFDSTINAMSIERKYNETMNAFL